MKIVSIKRLVLALILGLGSVMTLPAYAWPDTDEMNMCGAAVKKIRAYGGDHRGWQAHDNYIKHLGAQYYYLANCPQSKATKNYKGNDWTPGAKMQPKHKMHKKHSHKHKHHAKHAHKHHKRHHVAHHGMKAGHKKTEDCIRTDALNNSGPIVKKASHRRAHKADHSFYHQAQAVLNMSKVKHKNVVHNPKHKNHADCVRTDGLNHGGAIIRVVRKKHH